MSEYRTYTHADPFTPKRWAHQRRFVDALKLLPPNTTSLLDYGTGDGVLLKIATEKFPQARLVGFEPFANMAQQARSELQGLPLRIEENIDALQGQQFAVITCLETCEHLVPDALDETLQSLQQLLAPNGMLIMSAPIELGPVSLVKNMFRILRRKRYENISFANIVSAAIGIPPKQYINHALGFPYIFSHIGFDHRRLARAIENHFRIEHTVATPWPKLGPWLNPTVMFVCRLP